MAQMTYRKPLSASSTGPPATPVLGTIGVQVRVLFGRACCRSCASRSLLHQGARIVPTVGMKGYKYTLDVVTKTRTFHLGADTEMVRCWRARARVCVCVCV